MKTPAKRKGRIPARANLDIKIRHAKIVLRDLRAVLEDLEDRRDLARAKARNAGKAGVSLQAAKRELGLDF
jgi:hypothetical protein